MTHRLVGAGIVLAVVCALLNASGCAASPSNPIELTQDEDGSTQQLANGQELRIVLQSNPTTGYRWDIDGKLPPEMEQVGKAEYSSESTLVGAGGQETWTFRAASAGSGELRLKYWRSFEPTAAPADTFGVKVDVK